MKYCPYCKIHVKGMDTVCPLCQSPIQGVDEGLVWPIWEHQKKASLLYKIAKFTIFSCIAIALIVDFLGLSRTHVHFSAPIVILLVSMFWLVSYFYLKSHSLPKILFFTMWLLILNILYAAWFWGFLPLASREIIPNIVSVYILVNFILSFFDKRFKNNYLVYIFLNSDITIINFIVIKHLGTPSFQWVICFSVALIALIGVFVFREKNTLTEIQKRLHI
ncbi:MAG: DUF6320 domain-containing protein [Bacillota bacterium]|nr:DUF6320 domain-containing protein [Bacillota bacterium]